MESTGSEVRRLLLQGQRELRRGRVGAALACWEQARALDETAEDPRAFHDYVRRNRIRLSVHLSKHPPAEEDPLVLPKGWPTPPPRLCDPVPSEPGRAAETTPEPGRAAAPEEADTPPRQGVGDVPEAPGEAGCDAPAMGFEGDTGGDPSGEYAVLEIIVEDEDEPAAGPSRLSVSGEDELPPPPVSLDAPELDLDPPEEVVPGPDEPEDYVVGRSDSERLEAIVLERFAGTPAGSEGPESAASGAPSPPPPPRPAESRTPQGFTEEPSRLPAEDGVAAQRPPTFAEDAPTVARDGQAQSPVLVPHPHKAPMEPAPVALGPDGAPVSGQRPPTGLSPGSTLVGLGPDVLEQLEARGAAANQVGGVPDSREPTLADDFSLGEGSFSDDLPTRMRSRAAPPSGSQAHMPYSDPGDFSSGEGSFSDDLPTRARNEGTGGRPGVRPMPRASAPVLRRGDDFSSGEGSFSDDLPTRARNEGTGGRPGVRPMPPEPTSERDPSLPEGLVSGSALPEDVDAEMEGLVDPDRGVAIARRLAEQGEHERSLGLVERLLGRYRATPEMERLLNTNQQALEPVLLERVAPRDAMLRPRMPEAGLNGLDLDPRAAFLFSRIDGPMPLEDILDVSGMSRFETARLLLRLRELGLLEVESAG